MATLKYFVHWHYTGNVDGYFRSKTVPTIKEIKTMLKKEKVALRSIYDDEDHGTSDPDSDTDSMSRGVEDALNRDHQDLGEIKLALAFARFRDFPFDKAILLYLLADVLQVRGLKDQITTKMIEVYHGKELFKATHKSWGAKSPPRPNWLPDPIPSINLAWRMLPEHSHLRRLLLSLFVSHVHNLKLLFSGEALDYDFLVEAYTSRDKGFNYLWRLDEDRVDCEFHERDVPCRPIVTTIDNA